MHRREGPEDERRPGRAGRGAEGGRAQLRLGAPERVVLRLLCRRGRHPERERAQTFRVPQTREWREHQRAGGGSAPCRSCSRPGCPPPRRASCTPPTRPRATGPHPGQPAGTVATRPTPRPTSACPAPPRPRSSGPGGSAAASPLPPAGASRLRAAALRGRCPPRRPAGARAVGSRETGPRETASQPAARGTRKASGNFDVRGRGARPWATRESRVGLLPRRRVRKRDNPHPLPNEEPHHELACARDEASEKERGGGGQTHHKGVSKPVGREASCGAVCAATKKIAAPEDEPKPSVGAGGLLVS